MKRQHLLPQHLSQLLLVQLFYRVRFNRVVQQVLRCKRLVLWIVVILKVRMRQRLHSRDSRCGVKLQHPRNQIQRLLVLDPREDFRKRSLRLIRQVLQKLERAFARHVPNIVACGLARDITNQLQLVFHVLPRKQHTPGEHFTHDASNRPHVNSVRVVMAEDELRRAVPPRDDVIRLLPALLRVEIPREPEIANFEVTVCIHEHIRRFQVTVQHMSGM
mmetsp:Transcript_10770/g.22910  ORF Transcript_10770/g.22910 Transcript_10770/m.22910 type:complete len:218 (-) Transcript_10770:72-725(-)